MAELILHLPDLESTAPGRLPGPLVQALTKAGHAPTGRGRALAAALGGGSLPPAAAMSALGAGIDPGEACWLRFDVVRMQPDLTAVWIDRPVVLDFDAPSLSALKRELVALFESEGLADGLRFAGGFGLIPLAASPDCTFTDLSDAQGRRLDDCLPIGPDAPRWHRLMTAAQMLFHRFRALDRADPTGAGLWFWGCGRPPAPARPLPDLRIVDAFDSAMTRGLARWFGAEPETGPAGGHPGRPGDADRVFVEIPADHADPAGALQTLVEQRLEPALAALGRGRLDRIRIVGSSGIWRLGRFHALAVWRRRIRGLAAGDGPS